MIGETDDCHVYVYCAKSTLYILSRATFPGAPSYGGVRTWVDGSQTRGDRALAEGLTRAFAEASNLLGYNRLSIWIQITIHPLATAGAIVI